MGLLAGGITGAMLDQRDCQQAQMALGQMETARVGQQIAWANPATGNNGVFTPLSDAAPAQNGQLCRQYGQDNSINGQKTGGDVGVVCRTPEGDWQAVS